MAFVTFEFYGRFLLADEHGINGRTGKTTFIAPRMTKGGFVPHRPILTIPRQAVVIKDNQTTLAPTSRILTSAPQAEGGHLELFTWDLTGSDVSIVSSGGLTLAFDSAIVELEELERLVNRPNIELNKDHLKSNDLVASAIEIAGGQGIASTFVRNSAEFLTLADAKDTSNQDKILRDDERLADLVQIVLAGSRQVIKVSRTVDGRQTIDQITIDITGSPSRVVNVTNMCSAIPKPAGDTPYDFEFGEYFELLKAQYDDRLIPIVRHLGDAADCDVMARVSYK